ncbi:outer membrane protein assembly factor BamE [Avibacterium paragallinarum]|uniref:Outer membrane protein assembly factor BamE n=1 Tax=Avibacterium paragallinarum TaxID=728 RepID=A0A377I812_AVIPA|nr:outer membrane protein assembly factor BamE [Avibacterium paragallinarum]POY45289.1 outer membrane protein assembly factor BamE [Avibacterium paragallinarum]RZN75813.1 outer membrane protein assembly factor BamE [Avibacterium paragallinarum]STO70899.1 SmpA/OmlA domain-containing protein [Avibacterium paragallinarum]
MQLKTLLTTVLLALSVTACSTISQVVYRIDVPQGNYLEAAIVDQVKVGMNAQQVQYLLGTPVLIDPFSNNTWYYVFLIQKAYQKPDQHTFVVNFDHRGIVTHLDLDKPLPNNGEAEVNNAIIELKPKDKRWWQFWE